MAAIEISTAEVPASVLAMMADAQVPLDPDLEPFLDNSTRGLFGLPSLRHPLVMCVPFLPHEAKRANEALARKREALDAAITHGALYSVCFLHERPWRAQALLKHARLFHREQRLTPEIYWSSVRHVWVGSENVHDCADEWALLWDASWIEDPDRRRTMMKARPLCMDPKDREALAAMPATIRVYHGEEFPGVLGRSWTTSSKTAEWFARRFDGRGGGRLFEGKVRKRDVIAFITDRGESEILVEPEHVTITKTTKVA